jgi:hypothetical protein
MPKNSLPKMNIELPEGGCCPKFDPTGWDDQELVFENRLFVQMNTINFLHIPLNMGSAIKKSCEKAKEAKADPKDHYLLLSHDPSPWRGNHFMEVTKEVEGLTNVKISGKFLTKVFEGPYKEAGKWCKEMEDLVAKKGRKLKKLYMFYTTCPKCIKHWGKNYVIGFAEVE